MASRKSHSLKVESLLEVTTSLEVGCAEAWVSSSSWPDSWWSISPVWVSQMQACLSQPSTDQRHVWTSGWTEECGLCKTHLL